MGGGPINEEFVSTMNALWLFYYVKTFVPVLQLSIDLLDNIFYICAIVAASLTDIR